VNRLMHIVVSLALFSFFPCMSLASASDLAVALPDLTQSSVGYICLFIFIAAYLLVMAEEVLHLRKSKPVIIASGIIWAIIAWELAKLGFPDAAEKAVRHNILEYAELFLFLLVAMTYVNAMEERLVFEALRSWLVRKGFNLRQLFWITGILAFFISPIADNMTTALLMCAVIMAVGGDNARFVSISCISIVIAANAGGAFSPFGDITTLMVWQKGVLPFQAFFQIFIPSVLNFLVPAACMHFAIPKIKPKPVNETIRMKLGAKRVMFLFLLTIVTAVSFHNFLHMPPVVGMMLGFGYLSILAFFLKKTEQKLLSAADIAEIGTFDIFRRVERAEWDTLLFFYGIVLCVGGLSTLGYLAYMSHTLYETWGAGLPAIHTATPANVAIGLLSAVIDNIPVMFAVLTMNPHMSEGQWLLVTLTAGVGGSLLSIGSAAGVALMGQARGKYTFLSHLKWTWAIALGYVVSVVSHIWLNEPLFHIFTQQA
jgi:NhaD family Na+/H+ antiporter